MKPAAKRCLLDYFHATKKQPISLKTGNLDKSTKEKLDHSIESTSTILRSFKRRISTSDDNNNDEHLQPAKRLCTVTTPRKSNLLVPSANCSSDVNRNQPDKQQNRLSRLKKAIASASETLKQSQQNNLLKSSTVPANERFAALTAEDSEGLVLPNKYKMLLETFNCLDTIVSMLYNRNEICFIDKIQPSVKQMTRRTFNITHLGQIVEVNPNAFTLRLEPVPVNSFHKKDGGERQLTINPNLTDEDLSGVPQTNGFISMVPKIMVNRKNTFKDKLIEITKRHHERFLASLKFSINQNEIRRWHPAFMVDDVPDVQPADIPQIRKEKIATAQEVLEKVKGLYSKKLEEALETVASNTEATTKQSQQNPICPPKPAPKGVPLGLLEKIRAREAAKALTVITRDTELEKKQRMLSRLPEISRIMKNLFVGDRKTSLIAPYVFKKITDSYIGTLTHQQIEDHLKMLSELVPEWLGIIVLKDGAMYYKLQREMDFNAVLKKIVSSKS